MATADDGGVVRLFEIDTGREIGSPLTGHTEMVHDLAFSPDGSRLASASYDDTVRLSSPRCAQQVDEVTLVE